MSAAPALAPPPAGCFHCGEPLDAGDVVRSEVAGEVRAFCCHGCLGAAELIHELGLDSYYERREPGPLEERAADARALERWARFDDPALQRGFASEEPDGTRSAVLSVAGMRCAACSWLLEERLARLEGVREARFGLASGRARIRWEPGAVRLSAILAAVAALGYRAAPFEPDVEEAMVREERRAALRRLGVAGLGTMQVMMFSVALYAGAFGDIEAAHRDLLRWASLLVTAPVLAYAGRPFLVGAARDLAARRVGPDLLIGGALLGAFGASLHALGTGGGEVYFDSVCMFVFFLTVGRSLERDLRARAELRIRRLQRRVPEVAHRSEDGAEHDVPVAALAAGDVVVVRAGETVPADGCVIAGRGEVSEALLTGEAAPVAKQPGRPILAGSENLDATLRMRVERTGPATTLRQVASLLDRAQLEKPPVAETADRVARVFLSAVLLVAAVAAAAWWWLDPSRVVPVVISVLIATCPCALSLATPAALAAATHGLAARGWLVTRGHALEALARVTRVVFDKTGTLTAPTPRLAGVTPLREGLTPDRALVLAAALELRSVHPLARAVRAAARPGAADTACGLESVPGCGVAGRVEGRLLRLGRPTWSAALAGAPLPGPPPAGTVALLADERGPLAWLAFETPLRDDAAGVLAWLRARGIATALVSGDPAADAVREVGDRLGIDDVHAGVSPAGKVAAVEGWLSAGDVVLAVGDGVNDAPLLGRAQVSLAMGSGSDLARLRADAVLLDDRLASLPLALRWARRAQRVVRQNFAWAIAYNASVLPLAVAGLLPPWLAALGMSASSLLVVANSLRLHAPPRGDALPAGGGGGA